MRILVLGGTRFFGKRLVERLLESGDEVTIATRGQTEDPFGDRVRRVQVDRTDEAVLKERVGSQPWDIVYDQICFAPDEAAIACRVFAEHTRFYVYTSSMSVYDIGNGVLHEEAFDPYTYKIAAGDRNAFDYGEGKRLAEAVFLQQAPFPVAAVRLPIVMGEDDYTERLVFHVDRVKNREPIVMPNRQAELVFISSEEAARFLEWIGKERLDGPYNACANGSISLDELLGMIETATGEKAVVQPEGEEKNASPYGIPKSWVMSNEKASKAGFPFTKLRDWLPGLIRALAH
ncbi:MAG TPA: NAD-dependent epimerase/dehydratase family protein [Bacillales bacterium]|nr:NAD-dependent epimerase/dehydratase family protein [Bacillales bacterium]